MSTVSDLKKSLMQLDIRSLTEGIIESNEQIIVDLNREDQIFIDGIDSRGRSLDTYAKSTQRMYDKDPPADLTGMMKTYRTPLNLFWTGKSYYGFKTYTRGDSLFITTNSRGRKLLIENGGPAIFGLTPDNQEVVNWEIIAPELIEAIRKKIL